MSWHNGDHGFDDINSTGVTYIGDDAFGNFRDGFSFDGTSPNAHIENCIAAENGLISQRFDLWVSIASADSFTSDYNIFWNSTSQPIIKHVTTQYVSLPVFSATTGQDTHSIQFDPAFMNPWAGDFRLVSGSIAIDNGDADAPGWADRDAAGKPRVDDPSSPNLGVGPIAYGDRGALEFPATQVVVRPLASMVVTPNIGSEPLPVTVDASGSSDTGGGIVTYTFDFGDGTTQGPQASAFATHTYAAGNWTMTLTVTNQEGAARATWVLVLVGSSSPPNLVLNSSFEQDLSGWAPYGAAVLALVPGGYDGVQSVQMTGTATDYAVFGINDHNNWVHSVPVIETHYRFSAWVMSPSSTGQAKLSVSEFVLTTGEQVGSAISTGVTLSPAWQQITMDYIAARQGTTLDFHVRDDPVAIGEVFQTDAIVINDLGPTVTGVGSPAASSSLAPMLYPSPLRTASTLRFATSRPGRLRVEILDLAGRRVRQLINEPQAVTGVHQLSVSRGAGRDGPALGPGVYFYRVADVDGIRSGRFVVLC
jgi:hypothetical protein